MNISSRAHRAFVGALAAFLLAIPAAQGAPFIVTTGVDNAPNSLRQAINATPAGGSIEFNIPTSDPSYNVTTGVYNILLTGAELQIARDLTITGPTNAKIAVSGNNLLRVFNILAGTVKISNLTIKDGRVFGANGANSVGNNPATPGAPADGGGIMNSGVLTLRNCSLSQNAAVAGAGGNGVATSTFPSGAAPGEARGGGIYNAMTLTLINCTIWGNAAVGGRGGDGTDGKHGAYGGNASGAGVLNAGALTVINCTSA